MHFLISEIVSLNELGITFEGKTKEEEEYVLLVSNSLTLKNFVLFEWDEEKCLSFSMPDEDSYSILHIPVEILKQVKVYYLNKIEASFYL